ELIVAARPVVAVIHAPTNSALDKLRSDLVAVRISENAKQISGLHSNFESRRIQSFARRQIAAAGQKRSSKKRHPQNSRAEKSHLARNDRDATGNFNRLGDYSLFRDRNAASAAPPK